MKLAGVRCLSSQLLTEIFVIGTANSHPAKPDWSRIEIVLLDMDGTLLDLRFDNYFWTELIPLHFGVARGLALHEAQAELRPRFAQHQGTLKWYCTDHWSRELGLNVADLKHEAREHIRFLPGAEDFLVAVRQMGRRVVLVTNAHQDACRVKFMQTGLDRYLDDAVTSHSLGHPKEEDAFWPKLEKYIDLKREQALFVDDNLPVLHAARAYGVGQLFAVARPDTSLPVREIPEFPVVRTVKELLLQV